MKIYVIYVYIVVKTIDLLKEYYAIEGNYKGNAEIKSKVLTFEQKEDTYPFFNI